MTRRTVNKDRANLYCPGGRLYAPCASRKPSWPLTASAPFIWPRRAWCLARPARCRNAFRCRCAPGVRAIAHHIRLYPERRARAGSLGPCRSGDCAQLARPGRAGARSGAGCLAGGACAWRAGGGVCLGAYLLAQAGLLDGRSATTHWAYAADFARRHPQVRLNADVLYLADGALLTSAGTAAALDCCPAAVARAPGQKTPTARRADW